MYLGNTFQLEPVLTPEPTLDTDKRLVYTSFNEDVVTVDENGLLTAVSEGYAYIAIETASGADVETYCVVQVVACMDHTYGDWTVTIEPDCETEGEQTRVCTKCGYTDTQVIPAAGHTEGEWIQTQAPSCTDSGAEVLKCAVCQELLDERSVPALGHDYDEEGCCKRCGEEEDNGEYTAKWTSVSTTLSGNIGLNFYAQLSENLADNPDAYVRFTINGRTIDVRVADAAVTDNGYRFTCPITAKNMADSVTAQVMVGDETVGTAKTMDVATYCNWVIDNFTDEKTVNLMKAMLNYGASAQMLFDHNTDNLANAALDEADKALPNVDASAFAHSVTGTEDGIQVDSMTLLLDSETSVRVYFKLTGSKTIGDYTFCVDGREVTPVEKDGMYYVQIPDIAAHRLGQMYVVTVGGITVTYGALSYINQVLTTPNVPAEVINMAKALFIYYEAAYSYIN